MIVTTAYGRISSDIKMTETNEGKAIAKFSLAVNKGTRGAEFFNFTAFGKTAETINEFFHKGSRIMLEAEPTPQKRYEGKDGKYVYPNVDFRVIKFDFVDTKSENVAHTSNTGDNETQAEPYQEQSENKYMDMDIPDELDLESLPFR